MALTTVNKNAKILEILFRKLWKLLKDTAVKMLS